MLSLCLPEEHKHNPPADLLKRCLDAVLHICNDQKSPMEDKGKEQTRGDNLRGCLTGYLTEWCGALFVPPAAHFSYTIPWHTVGQVTTRIKAICRLSKHSTTPSMLCARLTYRCASQHANQQTCCFFIEMIRRISSQCTMAVDPDTNQISSSSLWV